MQHIYEYDIEIVMKKGGLLVVHSLIVHFLPHDLNPYVRQLFLICIFLDHYLE